MAWCSVKKRRKHRDSFTFYLFYILVSSGFFRFSNYHPKLWILLDILVGLLGRGIGLSAYRKAFILTGQHNTVKRRNYIHASSGVRTHDSSVWAMRDHTRFKPSVSRDWSELPVNMTTLCYVVPCHHPLARPRHPDIVRGWKHTE